MRPCCGWKDILKVKFVNDVYVPSTWRRLAAQGVDSLLRLFFYLPFARMFFLLIFTDDDVRISLVQLLIIFLVPAVYEFIFLVLFQATPGKWLMGLKVVPFAQPTEKLQWGQCVLRPLVERLTFFFSWALYATAFFRYDRTHLADWVAETRVVQFTPRVTRSRIRWFLGTLFVIFYAYDGLTSSRNLMQIIDWENHEVDLRALLDSDGMMEIVDEYAPEEE